MKPSFNVGSSLARQRNAILMAFCWWADDGLFLALFGSSIPHQLKFKKKTLSNLDPLCQIPGSAHVYQVYIDVLLYKYVSFERTNAIIS